MLGNTILLKQLIDRDKVKEHFLEILGIGSFTFENMADDVNVNIGEPVKSLKMMECELSDIIEPLPDTPPGHTVPRRTRAVPEKAGNTCHPRA